MLQLRKKEKEGEILRKELNIKFVNPNTEQDIVQAMAGVLAYNIREKDENTKFEYSKSPEKKKRKAYER